MALACLMADKTWREALPNLPGASSPSTPRPSAASIDKKSAPFAGTARWLYEIA
jgi:hypothetical protein